MWNFGLSGSAGPYFHEVAAPSLPLPVAALVITTSFFLAQDASFEWHRHWQIWAEFARSAFRGVPLPVGNADVFGYFLEAKYKFTPQFFGAVRWNHQLYDTVPDGSGGEIAWGHDAWRIDTAVAYRFTTHIQLKVQYDLEHDDNARTTASATC